MSIIHELFGGKSPIETIFESHKGSDGAITSGEQMIYTGTDRGIAWQMRGVDDILNQEIWAYYDVSD